MKIIENFELMQNILDEVAQKPIIEELIVGLGFPMCGTGIEVIRFCVHLSLLTNSAKEILKFL